MTSPVNLNKVRKARKRSERKAQADANAAKHGRSKTEKLRDQAEADATARLVDLHKRDP